MLDSTKRLANLGKIGSVSDAKVSNFARVLVTVNLQRIRTILESAEVWGFSIAFDSSNHRGGSYFAQRIRFYRSGDVINLHLLSVPMFELHTASNMFALSVKVLDVVCPSWRDKLLGIGTDGANVMTGRLGGMATLLEKEASFMGGTGGRRWQLCSTRTTPQFLLEMLKASKENSSPSKATRNRPAIPSAFQKLLT